MFHKIHQIGSPLMAYEDVPPGFKKLPDVYCRHITARGRQEVGRVPGLGVQGSLQLALENLCDHTFKCTGKTLLLDGNAFLYTVKSKTFDGKFVILSVKTKFRSGSVGLEAFLKEN